MQVASSWRVTERPSGTGTVYDDDGELATVTYQLVVEEPVPVPPDLAPCPPDRAPQVSGSVMIVAGRTDLVRRGTLTLHLRDNRRLDFVVSSQPSIAVGPLAINAVGPLRSVGERTRGR